MMADESDDCRDVVRYWRELEGGVDCVFGSRFTMCARLKFAKAPMRCRTICTNQHGEVVVSGQAIEQKDPD